MGRTAMSMWAGLCLILLQHVNLSDGFSNGAPPNTCWTRYPKHGGLGTQNTVCPFIISMTPESYTPGQEVTVTISDPTSQRSFNGFQIGAYVASGVPKGHDSTEEVVGRFTVVPQGVRVFSCYPGFQNMATHDYLGPSKNVSMTWRAPDNNMGNLTFRATVVMDYHHFWTGETKELPVSNAVTADVVEPSYQTPTLTTVKSLSFSECGSTKSCLYYPRHCDGSNCIAAVSFLYRQDTNDYLVEMFSDATKNYVSVGFSDDKVMGGEETYTCVSQGHDMSVQHGWNPAYYNERLFTGPSLTDLEVRHADGRLECRFVIQHVGEVYRINASATDGLDFQNIDYDRSFGWYLQLAWGKSMPDSNVITYHDDMPVTSDNKVVIKEPGVHRGSAYHILVRAHVAVMVVAWVFLSGLVTVVARHYRNWLGHKQLCGTKIWFQVHRELAILIVILTFIGLMLIFARFDWEAEIREQAIPHAYVGLALTGALGLQVLAGMVRPGAESKYRPYFNWGHRFLGQSSHILAAVTMFLAFDIKYITKDMQQFGYITLGFWVGVQLLWHLILEVFRCRNASGKSSFTVSGPSGGEGRLPLDTALLVIYGITLAGLATAVMLSFLLF